jgi:hypothetical protein
MKRPARQFLIIFILGFAAVASYAQEWKPWAFKTYDQWVPWEKVTEQQRRHWNEEYDREGLYGKTGFVTDRSPEFLAVPEALVPSWPGGMTVAREVPTIDFAPVRGLDPMYFPEDNKSLWSNWAGVGRAPNGKFYFAEGDHRAIESHLYLFEYDPAARTVRKVVDFADLCGWKKRGVGDSKIHGDLDIMPDGTLWILTYWDPDPKPTLEQYERWPGSHLVRFDTNTGQAEDSGVLIPKCGWPEFKVDARRGVLFAVGFRNEVLSYDVVNRKINWCGYPPAGIIWDNRSSLHDPDTGLFWCVEAGGGGHLVSFNPATNTFMKYPERSPYRLRTYTRKRSADGSFWATTKGDGAIFKFWPDSRRVEPVTNQWRSQGYCPRFAVSGNGKYIYYMAGIDLQGPGGDYREQPVVQLNTETGVRKVIAFPTDYYFKKYGYAMMIPFGMELSADGSLLVINLNGAFKPRVQPLYGNPALMVVHVPESERKD